MNHINLSRHMLPTSLTSFWLVMGKFSLFIFCSMVGPSSIQELAAQCTLNFSACPPDQTIVDSDNSGSEKIEWPLVLAYNAGFCNNYSVTQITGPAPNSVVSIGSYLITYYAEAINTTDGSTVATTCQFNVNIVKDNQPPTFTSCPPNITVTGTDDGTGNCSTQAYWPSPIGTDNSGPITIVATGGIPCGNSFPMGQTTVSYSTTDPSGNVANCTFTVTVICMVKTFEPGKSAYQVRIAPNPSPGTFTVELPEPAKPGTMFNITDLAGRQVKELKSEPGNTFQTVQVTNLPPSLYFLQVVHDGKVLAVEKFVKQ